ncbi:MAG: LCCL domain-containing protein [Pyrinomonadaceae bacterium]
MKRCSKCDQTYVDDTLNYCLTDGTELTDETDASTVVMERPTVTAQTQRKNRPALWIVPLALIMLLMGAVIGAILIYLYVKNGDSAHLNIAVNTPRPTATPRRTLSPIATNPAADDPSKNANAKTPIDNNDPDEVTPIGWDTTAGGFKGEPGKTYTFECPPDGTPQIVFGSDVYTDYSSICTAAVHAGVITKQDGGTVTIEYRPGRETYGSTVRNGIKTTTTGEHTRSFVVR